MRKNNFSRRPQRPKKRNYDGPKDTGLTVYVHDGNVEIALRKFKKKVKTAGIIEDVKSREFFQTRREKRRLLKDKAVRRQKRLNEEFKQNFLKRNRVTKQAY